MLGYQLVLLFCLTSAAVAGNYYLDCKQGQDSNLGTSPRLPWRTLGRANSVHLSPGDAL